MFDSPNRVLAVGRQRSFTGALRRAIQVRDRFCRHLYCDQPAEQCDIDHIEPWAHGGDTTETNGRAFCGYHNRLRNQPNQIPPQFSKQE